MVDGSGCGYGRAGVWVGNTTGIRTGVVFFWGGCVLTGFCCTAVKCVARRRLLLGEDEVHSRLDGDTHHGLHEVRGLYHVISIKTHNPIAVCSSDAGVACVGNPSIRCLDDLSRDQ